MKLYTFSAAPNPQRVGYLLKYKGLSIETEEIDLKEKAQFNESFLKINPAATVPTLYVNENCTLTDAIAICCYLDKKYPEKPLFGANDEEYALIIGWLHRVYIDGLVAIGEILRNQSEFFKDRALPGSTNIKQIPALVERGKVRLSAFWKQLDEHLSDKNFIVGSKLSQADIDAYVVCNFAGWVKETIPKSCTNIINWRQRVTELLGD